MRQVVLNHVRSCTLQLAVELGQIAGGSPVDPPPPANQEAAVRGSLRVRGCVSRTWETGELPSRGVLAVRAGGPPRPFALLGTVAESILRQARKPVFVVRPPPP